MSKRKIVEKIYPTGHGHYALGSPDGVELRAGLPLQIVLAGRILEGEVCWATQGDYVQFPDQSFCPLAPEMRVMRPPAHQLKIRRRRGRYAQRFAWTSLQQQSLKERYLQLVSADPDTSLAAICRQITLEEGWPAQAVRTKLYQIRRQIQATQLVKQQTAKRLEHAFNLPPVNLQPGIYNWTVLLPARTAWLLDYPYGQFPVMEGQRCRYNGCLYRVERVGTSQVSVVGIGLAVQAVERAQKEAVYV